MVGLLTIAGVARSTCIRIAITQEADKIAIKGHHMLVLKDFDIEPPTAMFGQIVVGDEVMVDFNLVFKKN